jgi:hypothetical protein
MDELPIIYGRNLLIQDNNEIICGLDIFASSFFMLTRWEEYFIKEKSSLGRRDENKLLSIREQFYLRPVVNEYCSLFIYFCKFLSIPFEQKIETTEIILSHDVDRCVSPSLYITSIIRRTCGLIYHKRIVDAFLFFIQTIKNRIFSINSNDCFDELMDKSDQYGFKNYFFFKACNVGEEGFTYSVDDPIVKAIINNIEKRGHFIGFHPSENTIDNFAQLEMELNRLKKNCKHQIKGGRCHGLYYNKNTFSYWDALNLNFNSDFGFQFYNGFHAGICSSYPLFDIYKRKTLDLYEVPFIAMDSVWYRNNKSVDAFYQDVVKLIDRIISYNGLICINWHTHHFNNIDMRKFRFVYFRIIDYLGSKVNMIYGEKSSMNFD